MAHWQDDEGAFQMKFGISYPSFVTLVNSFDDDELKRYDSICQASKRAAILWAIDQGKTKGLLGGNAKTHNRADRSPFVEAAHQALALAESREED